MATATIRGGDLSSAPAPGASVRTFLVHAVCWNVALFALVRLSWIERHVIDALIEFQKALVFWYGATPTAGIIVNSSCSGADVMALCAGVILAYPTAWRRRIIGAAFGLAMVLALNAVRIGTLYAVAADRQMLNLLHLYVWPALLTIAVLVYVMWWVRRDGSLVLTNRRWLRFGVAAGVALVLYAAAAPWVMTSQTVHTLGVWTASAGGAILGGLGASVRTSGNVLVTTRGAFQVTQECLFTPALPLYLAAILTLPLSTRRRMSWLLLTVPLFLALGVARLLVLALPPSVSTSPAFLAHGFYQLAAGLVIVVVAAHVSANREAGLRATMRTAGALGLAGLVALVAGPFWEMGLVRLAIAAQAVIPATIVTLAPAGDQQGALALMPVFQVALLLALWVAVTGGRRPAWLVSGLAVLAGSQVVFLSGAGLVSGWLSAPPHALAVRAWALGVPVLIALAWRALAATRFEDPAYRRFWHDVGERFPSLTGAASTQYYFENEQRLIAEALPSLEGCTLLKTDLWDEAKNTRILQWAADRGARVFGIDLSEPIVRQAREAFGERQLRPLVSDVRRLPFADASFDAIYSMGTIEHFEETEASVAELARILKPGGRIILGVPNRHDPFLRPLLVAALSRLGLYAYGFEKSYSRRALRGMLESAGLDVRAESGILFMPGWLRMLDLWCYTRLRPLAVVTGALVAPFVWLWRRFPVVGRHGYLIASVAEKPVTHQQTVGTGGRGPQLEIAPGAAAASQAFERAGTAYLIDARGCDAEALQSLPRLQRLFGDVLEELSLQAVAPPVWHVFPGQGGVTGMVLLSESHLTIHTYPEIGAAAIDLYCCRPSADWPWTERLQGILGARDVEVRTLRRG